MKINMKHGEEKGGSVNKIRIAVFGQHDVGKSALTVRFLTRRYIGEYKSNTDLLYRQTVSLSHGSSLDIEIVDISTSCDSPNAAERKTFPVEELSRSDGFIIVYSITDRSSFSTAIQALADIQSAICPPTPPPTTAGTPTTKSPPVPVALIGNKADLEHLRVVTREEAAAVCAGYEGCTFAELSVAENSPEVYSSFQGIIDALIAQVQMVKRVPRKKFSVSKRFGNLRLGRNSPSVPALGAVTMCDESCSSSSSREGSPALGGGKGSGKHERQSSGDSTGSSNLSIGGLKSKLHSMKRRQQSPPICSL